MVAVLADYKEKNTNKKAQNPSAKTAHPKKSMIILNILPTPLFFELWRDTLRLFFI